MDALLRLVGLQTISTALARLDGRAARWLSVAVLVLVNLWPLSQVLAGIWEPGDVIIFFWLENLVIWLVTIVRIATAQGAPRGSMLDRSPRPGPATIWNRLGNAAFFSVHYGLFTAMHGAFTYVLALMVGAHLERRQIVGTLIALAISHGFSLALYWFARDERQLVSPTRAMIQPYGRVVVLHAALIATTFLLVRAGERGADHGSGDALFPNLDWWPAAVLVGLKILVDVALHLHQHRATR